MPLVRAIARPLLASMFIYDGIDAYRHPAAKAAAAEKLLGSQAGAGKLSTEQIVQIDGAAKVAAAVALGLGRFPRVASLVLAGSLIPTTLAEHRFWEEDDPARRDLQKIHFMKNLSMLGGVLLAAVDTAGKPSLGWRARRGAHQLAGRIESGNQTVSAAAHAAVESLNDTLSKVTPS